MLLHMSDSWGNIMEVAMRGLLLRAVLSVLSGFCDGLTSWNWWVLLQR